MSDAGGDFQIVVDAVDRYLSDVAPRSAGNVGAVTLNLSGLPFVEGMGVDLRGAGHPTLSAEEVTLVSPTALWARFDLSGVTPDVYDVVAVWPHGGEDQLSGAFEVAS